MPLMKIYMIKGRTEEDIKKILDISYKVMLESFDAPEGDRYQLVSQHEAYEMQILDTGLGISRTSEILVFSLISRPRTTNQKELFYSSLVSELHDKMNIRKEDIMINISINADEDWSFFGGRAQFLTGEL